MQPGASSRSGRSRLSQRRQVIGVSAAAAIGLIHFVRQEASARHGGHPAGARQVRCADAGPLGLLALNGDTRKMGDPLYDMMLLRMGLRGRDSMSRRSPTLFLPRTVSRRQLLAARGAVPDCGIGHSGSAAISETITGSAR